MFISAVAVGYFFTHVFLDQDLVKYDLPQVYLNVQNTVTPILLGIGEGCVHYRQSLEATMQQRLNDDCLVFTGRASEPALEDLIQQCHARGRQVCAERFLEHPV